ncbi:adenosylcobinamide amidohydrolase [Halomarina litorea]|uniref:adenosylcobinamide amidohydrolase n=1 Tax=Halomarina litorea TaxID=2961595 RepID=UPI0020C4F5C7|nr:adenosylcobinamide amidohydrolase [Halomarina sp. BCD28]
MTNVETAVRDGVLRVRRPHTRWLSSGWRGGFSEGETAYNVAVPEGWTDTDLDGYIRARRDRAGFAESGPTLLTGVEMRHARGARCGPVAAVATAGVSNPAELPMDPDGSADGGDESSRPGTVNVLLWTGRALTDGALASLLALAAEAKAATLLARVGVPGTTSDAAVVGCERTGPPEAFAGSATEVGACARACVREAVGASLDARYPEGQWPEGVEDAEYGVATTRRASLFEV